MRRAVLALLLLAPVPHAFAEGMETDRYTFHAEPGEIEDYQRSCQNEGEALVTGGFSLTGDDNNDAYLRLVLLQSGPDNENTWRVRFYNPTDATITAHVYIDMICRGGDNG
jgi:hypothetical protein